MTEHKTYVGIYIDHPHAWAAYYGYCHCDFKGPGRTVYDLAQADANAHELAMLGEDGEADDAETVSVF